MQTRLREASTSAYDPLSFSPRHCSKSCIRVAREERAGVRREQFAGEKVRLRKPRGLETVRRGEKVRLREPRGLETVRAGEALDA